MVLCTFPLLHYFSFPVDLYRSQGHPPEVLELIETLIFKMIEPLLLRLMNKSQTLKVQNEFVLPNILSFAF